MNAASLLVARYLVTHALPQSRASVPDYTAWCQWARADFGVLPDRRTLIESRSQLVDLIKETP